MPRVIAIAGLQLVLVGCSELLGVDGVVYRGDAEIEAATDAAPDVMADVMMDVAPPSCDGPCPPTTLVTKTGLVPALATDGAHVFFRTTDTVWSCPTTGCASPTFVASTSTAGLQTVSASMDLVVWSDGTKVLGCAPGACGTPTTYVDFAPKPVTGIAASVASSFVLASGGDASVLSVHRISLDGQTDTQVFSGSPGGGAPGPVAAVPKAQHVYWSQVGTPAIYDCTQAQCASAANTLTGIASPTALVATGTSVFIASGAGLVVAPSNLATSTPFASGAISGLALSPNSTARVYFATGTNVESCATSASPPCAPSTHHTGSGITAIAADDTAIYWIEGASVMRLAL